MSGFVRRFLDELRENTLDELFETQQWREARNLSGRERDEYLINLYKEQLKSAGEVKYVRTFEMRGERNLLLYDLVFATKHWRGLEVMKEAMWKADPRGTYRFSDTTDVDQLYIIDFSDESHWLQEAADRIFKKFKSKTVSVEEIHKFVITETPFIFRKGALKLLEDTSKIIDVEGRMKRFSYPKRCKITFIDSLD